MYFFRLAIIHNITLTVLTIYLSACMVGPNFQIPAPPTVKRYTKAPLPIKTVSSPGVGKASHSQTFITSEEIPAQWWTLFHSTSIDQLISAGLANSPNIASAYAALKNAQETLKAQIGNTLLPAINTSGYGEKERFSFQTFGANGNLLKSANVFNLYNASVNVSYTVDVFGAARREIESLRAQVDYQEFELIAVRLTLTSNIVTTAISVASYQAQINATIALIKAQSGLLTILNQQYKLGGVSQENVLIQQTLVEQTRATLPPLQKNLSLSKHALSVLIGDFPNGPLPVLDLNTLRLPSKLPVSLPSDLVRQRPDVRAAEALIHATCAQVGVATANLFPQFTINGSDGWISTVFSTLFNNQNQVWNLIAQGTQPIFHGGALFAQRRAAIASFDQAYAQYRQTVLLAFQNVADALRAVEIDARTLQAQKRAEDAALGSLKLTRNQFRLGGVSYINLLNAQQQYQQTLISRIQAQAMRYSDTTALFQALGGGWWNATESKFTQNANVKNIPRSKL